MVSSMVRPSHKGAENQNRPQRKEQQYKVITKGSLWFSCYREQELHVLGLLEEAPCHCEQEPQVPLPVVRAFPACWIRLSPREKATPVVRIAHVHAAVLSFVCIWEGC